MAHRERRRFKLPTFPLKKCPLTIYQGLDNVMSVGC
jgi:hypothetical protein